MRIVDAWMQHPSAQFLRDPMFDSLRRWAHGQLAGDEVPVEATVAAMDAAGVQTGMLCAWWGPRGPLIANDEVAAIVRRYPGRLAGVAAVDLARPMEAVRELRRCVHALGFRALRVVPWLWDLPPSDRRYYPLYAECVELGIPFCLQVGHTGPLRPSEPGRPMPAGTFPAIVVTPPPPRASAGSAAGYRAAWHAVPTPAGSPSRPPRTGRHRARSPWGYAGDRRPPRPR
jgi:uncharacterized protein